uniref:DDE_Tnp_IS1595 domain-containing protein n=1 Tax=Strongyloides papillosus TaxID=174720 RepID=A0A0N5BLZ0_STREA
FLFVKNILLSKMALFQLYELVRDEEMSIKFLQEHELLPKTKECINGHEMKLVMGSPPRWRCYVRDCRKDIGIRNGTWFEGSRISFRTAILFIYCWTRELTSVDFCKEDLDMNHNTTVDWNNYLRKVCFFKEESSQTKIGGEGQTVEIDETLFVRRKNHCGRLIEQQWCFGGICRETREVFVEPVPDRSAKTLMEVLRRRVHEDTLIMSDMWKGYSRVEKNGYEHLQVNHKFNFVDPETGAHTQNIERVWRSVKERNKRQCGTRRSMLESYMFEFSWRKRNKENAFKQILADIKDFHEYHKKI